MSQDFDIKPPPQKRRVEFEQAATWATEVHGALRASRRTAWIVAAVASTVAVLEALALMFLAPLKTVVPYTILVDRQTGYVEMASTVRPGKMTQDAAVTQSFLVQYVLARETFDATDLSQNYRKVNLWSDGEARSQYQRDMQRTNPDSPLNLYPPAAVVSTTIKSVSLLSPTTAMVRFDTTRRDPGSAEGEQRSWAAVLAFRYSGSPMKMEDRFLNPLGFQVTRYRRDADTPLSQPAAAVATAPATSPSVDPQVSFPVAPPAAPPMDSPITTPGASPITTPGAPQ